MTGSTVSRTARRIAIGGRRIYNVVGFVKGHDDLRALGAGVTYTYDGDGERVKKSSGTLYWRGAGGTVLAETDTSGNTTNEYIFFGARIARRDSSGNVYYYFGNHLGSAAITNATGTLCYDADFYPSGGELASTNNCSQSYKFAGMEQDSETGDYHTLFRQYASNLGRWLSPDPLGGDITNPQSLNRYAYVLNNPASLVDPLGLDSMTSYGPEIAPGCPALPAGLPAIAYQQAQKCGTWLRNFKYNTGYAGCMSGEYGCGPGGNSAYTYGEDFFDVLASGNSEGTVWVDANGNVGYTVNPINGMIPGNSVVTETLTWWDGDVWNDVGLLKPANIQTEWGTIVTPSLTGAYTGVFSAASNSGFSPGYPGNPNFQPTGFVCATCGEPPIGTSPPKAASPAPKPPQTGPPPVLLPVPWSP